VEGWAPFHEKIKKKNQPIMYLWKGGRTRRQSAPDLRYAQVSKETCVTHKCQKRPTIEAKETHQGENEATITVIPGVTTVVGTWG